LEEEPERSPSRGPFNLVVSEWTPSRSSRMVPNLQSDRRLSAAIRNPREMTPINSNEANRSNWNRNVPAPREMTPFGGNETYRSNWNRNIAAPREMTPIRGSETYRRNWNRNADEGDL
jgi:hypothetical protein